MSMCMGIHSSSVISPLFRSLHPSVCWDGEEEDEEEGKEVGAYRRVTLFHSFIRLSRPVTLSQRNLKCGQVTTLQFIH